MGLVLLIPMLLLFYAMLVRPQRRQLAAHNALVASLHDGDEVVTAGGIFGTIRRIDDAIVDLEIAPGTTIRVARSAVTRRVGPEPDDTSGPAATNGPGDTNDPETPPADE
jgi:preprotein translocase subunit YajC